MDYAQIRGKIQYRERAQQIIDFSGIRYGNITPTDLDGLIEYKDKAVILIEMKYADTEVPYGQRLALERVTNDISLAGKACITLICSHDVSDPKQDIIANDANVREIYWNGKWHNGKKKLKEQVDSFLQWINNLPF